MQSAINAIPKLGVSPVSWNNVVLRRRVRSAALQLLVSTATLICWSWIVGLRSGLLHSLWALFTFHFWCYYLLYTACHLFALAAYWLVVEPARTPGVRWLDMLAWAAELTWKAFLGSATNDTARAKASLITAQLQRTALRAAFLFSLPAVSLLAEYSVWQLLLREGFPTMVPGLVIGFILAAQYLYEGRDVLHFPTIQRRTFFRLKMGVVPAAFSALTLAIFGTIGQEALVLYTRLPGHLLPRALLSFLALSITAFCLRFAQHVTEVVLTERHKFASDFATSADPNDQLLGILESDPPADPLILYLAYLDLCYVAERTTERWRRTALFEETGEAYRRVVAASLRPLEELVIRLRDSVEGRALPSSQVGAGGGDPAELFADYQLCAWGARAASALTATSRKEDTYGVAQRTGSNARVVSLLLSCLLAAEAYLASKTSSQVNKANSKQWQLSSLLGSDTRHVPARPSAVPEQALAVKDMLRTSLYLITGAFASEMLVRKPGGLTTLADKAWLSQDKLAFGSQEQLRHELLAILDYRE